MFNCPGTFSKGLFDNFVAAETQVSIEVGLVVHGK